MSLTSIAHDSLDQPDPRVVVTKNGHCLHLQLNDPDTLNAVDEGIARAFRLALDSAENDDMVDYVLVTSTHPKSFCSGGNVRKLAHYYANGKSEKAEKFFAIEYDLCARIAEFPKPYISLVDGYCIGGGLGITANGKHMVVTENALMSMPEVVLGFCTDAGMSWVLPRLWGDGGQADKFLGHYIALTGVWLNATDAVWTGLADYFIPSEQLPRVQEELLSLDYPRGEAATAIIDYLSAQAQLPGQANGAPKGQISDRILKIDEVFSAPSVAEMIQRLEIGLRTNHYGDWARDALSAIRLSSPTALEGTFLVVERGNFAPTVRAAIDNEFSMGAQYLCHREDFQTGVRARLIEKKPTKDWTPATLAEVDKKTLESR
ncbi:MAG TPA: enoyl-CoA hydratase/isomerase family protein [Corynebacteriales bacterium]|nr:enoyl-CoA hydratase/isomerase family protein [Mycobacteriales bacterium]